MALTAKQQAFVNAYVQHWNATQAAKDAGYKAGSESAFGTIGIENLQKLAINEAIAQAVEPLLVSRDEALARLGEAHRFDVSQYLTLAADGTPQLDIGKMREDGKGHLIRGIKNTAHGLVIEWQNPMEATKTILAALDKAAKGTEDDPIHVKWDQLSDEQLTRIAAGEPVGAVVDAG